LEIESLCIAGFRIDQLEIQQVLGSIGLDIPTQPDPEGVIMKSAKAAWVVLIAIFTVGFAYAQQPPEPQPGDQQQPYEQAPADRQQPSSQPLPQDQQSPDEQQPQGQYAPEQQQPPNLQYPPDRHRAPESVPQALESLRQSASSKTEFTLDHSMLIFASKLDSDNDDLRRVIAGVSGISIHRFHFSGPGMYDPAALRSVKEEYKSAGWKQLVNNHEKGGGPGSTGLWVRFENNAISDVAVLLAKGDSVNFIVVSGSISPMDLIHLGGHFGIPKIEGGVVVPQ
jgi:hypothetical protein